MRIIIDSLSALRQRRGNSHWPPRVLKSLFLKAYGKNRFFCVSLHTIGAPKGAAQTHDIVHNNNEIGVIGGGSWATAIVGVLLEQKGRRVCWWVRRAEVAEAIESLGHNPHYLPHLALDASRLYATTDLSAVLRRCEVVLLAVPSAYVPQVVQQVPREAWEGHRLASLVKGYIAPDSPVDPALSPTEYLALRCGLPHEALCVVSGASHAEEVAQRHHTFLTIASCNSAFTHEMAQLLDCPYIHTRQSSDSASLELCGLTKNIYAIATGIANGLGYGDNLLATLTAAAAREMHHLIDLPQPAFNMLSDLMVTCFSPHSRNRALGQSIAHGRTPQEHFALTGMVAEGYYAAATLHRLPIEAPRPIAEAVYRILYHASRPSDEFNQLIATAL